MPAVGQSRTEPGHPSGGLVPALRAAVEGSAVPMFLARRDGSAVICANAALAAAVGQPNRDLVGLSIAVLLGPEGAAAMKALSKTVDSATSGKRWEIAVPRAGEGSAWPCRLSLAPIAAEGAGFVMGVLEDLSELRDARVALDRASLEAFEAQARLVHSEKMASLGMLVAGIAHEINTPIGAVASMHHTLAKATDRLRTTFLSDKAAAGSPEVTRLFDVIQDANRVIVDGTGRITSVVRRLKRFARWDRAELQDADLNEGLEETLALIHHELKRDITVHRELGKLPVVACLPGRLKQVFLNILMNARQAMPNGGDLWVRSWSEPDNVFVQIEDNGHGIPADVIERIFEPGFTTKSPQQGTGLGLSICQKILQEHEGELSVTSEPGHGAQFTLRIPRDLRDRLGDFSRPERSADPTKLGE